MAQELRYTVQQRTSFHPVLELDVPLAPPACVLHVLLALPPPVFFDPYTARWAHGEVRRAQVLGDVELEMPAGWTALAPANDRNSAAHPWHHESVRTQAACEGEQCERTAVLLELDGVAPSKVRIPLHVRYALADTPPPSVYAPYIPRWDGATPPAWCPAALHGVWASGAALAQRAAAVVAPLRAVSYRNVDLMPDAPVYFAACDAPLDDVAWDVTGT